MVVLERISHGSQTHAGCSSHLAWASGPPHPQAPRTGRALVLCRDLLPAPPATTCPNTKSLPHPYSALPRGRARVTKTEAAGRRAIPTLGQRKKKGSSGSAGATRRFSWAKGPATFFHGAKKSVSAAGRSGGVGEWKAIDPSTPPVGLPNTGWAPSRGGTAPHAEHRPHSRRRRRPGAGAVFCRFDCLSQGRRRR